MKRKALICIVLIIASALLALVAVMPMQRAKADRADWMKALSNDTPLNQLTIPGTHDSGALHSIAQISGKCQTLSIKQQLKIGVRFLDIRLQLVGSKLRVVHSFVDQLTDFEDVLEDVTAFLQQNPSEFIILSIKEDADKKSTDKDFTATLEAMLLSHQEISRECDLPKTVGEARGKAHVIARYKNATIGLPCYSGWADDASFEISGIYVQDNYCVPNAAQKIGDIHSTYQVAAEGGYALVLNYTSCYLEKCFPPLYAGLPAHDINKDTLTALAANEGPLGVLVCDFITDALAGAIVGRNFA